MNKDFWSFVWRFANDFYEWSLANHLTRDQKLTIIIPGKFGIILYIITYWLTLF